MTLFILHNMPVSELVALSPSQEVTGRKLGVGEKTPWTAKNTEAALEEIPATRLPGQ